MTISSAQGSSASICNGDSIVGNVVGCGGRMVAGGGSQGEQPIGSWVGGGGLWM